MKTILFVCTANIARSPMAAALFNKLVGDMGLDDQFRAESAGTWGMDDLPAADDGQKVMRNRGLDTSSHRSRVVTGEILKNADLILTMEAGHAEALKIEFRDMRGKIYLLSEMVGLPYNIGDPFGSGVGKFDETAGELEFILEAGINKMIKLAIGDAED